MNKLFDVVETSAWKKHWLWIILAVALAAGLAAGYIWRPAVTLPAVDSAATAMVRESDRLTRRVEAIADSVAAKEVRAHAEIKGRVNALAPDDVVSALSDLLAGIER